MIPTKAIVDEVQDKFFGLADELAADMPWPDAFVIACGRMRMSGMSGMSSKHSEAFLCFRDSDQAFCVYNDLDKDVDDIKALVRKYVDDQIAARAAPIMIDDGQYVWWDDDDEYW